MRIIWLLPLLMACNSNSAVKVYKHSAVKQGFERKQGNEFLTYQQADGWFAVSPQDMEYILNKLDTCKTQDGNEIEQEEVETYFASQGL